MASLPGQTRESLLSLAKSSLYRCSMRVACSTAFLEEQFANRVSGMSKLPVAILDLMHESWRKKTWSLSSCFRFVKTQQKRLFGIRTTLEASCPHVLRFHAVYSPKNSDWPRPGTERSLDARLCALTVLGVS